MILQMFQSPIPLGRRDRRHKLQKRPRGESVASETRVLDSAVATLTSSRTSTIASARHWHRRRNIVTDRPWFFHQDKNNSILEFKAIRYLPETVTPVLIASGLPQARPRSAAVNPERHSAAEDAVLPEFRHLHSASCKKNSANRGLDVGGIKLSTEDSEQQNNRVSVSTIRRTAKTPVFAIGDLEAAHSAGRQAHAISGRIERRRRAPGREAKEGDDGERCSPATPSFSSMTSTIAPSSPELPHLTDHHTRRQSHNNARQQQRHSLRHQKSYNSLPTFAAADSGLSARKSACRPKEDPSQENDNLGLQICLDLLTEELVAAADGASEQLGSDMSRLKVWLMIEAFERLRGRLLELQQVVDARTDKTSGEVDVGDVAEGEAEESLIQVESMMNVWIRALQRIYDVLDRCEDGLLLESRRASAAGHPGVE